MQEFFKIEKNIPLKVNTKEHKVMIAARIILAFTIAVISWQATIQNGIEAPPVMNGDKVLHFFAFAVLALLVDFAFPRIRFGAAKITILVFYGFAIEVVQSYLAYRSASAADLGTDILGICAYALFIPLLKRFQLYREYWKT
ncbi:MAG: VanZ family protein [Chlorobiaceae bacterium]|jgi:VanZ family protein|nr:VanZ family protein [Chlorobiaceae bacterium]NTV16824.1 VanZ family protein [Chlorobiaceae bacterium]